MVTERKIRRRVGCQKQKTVSNEKNRKAMKSKANNQEKKERKEKEEEERKTIISFLRCIYFIIFVTCASRG
jgi:hypothetical protein